MWAKSFVTGTNNSELLSVTTDSNGDIYVAGEITGKDLFYLGNAVAIAGTSDSQNVFVAKYDSSGNALWTRSTIGGPNSSTRLSGIAVDSSGDVYVAGSIDSNSTYDFGDGVTAAGSNGGSNIILIKYNSNGIAKWAKTVSGANNDSILYSVALDNKDNPHVGGEIEGTSTFNFGNNITVTPPSTNSNILVAQYNSTGYPQWVKTLTSSPGESKISAIAIDIDGNIFASGDLIGSGTYELGNGVNATGIYSGKNALLIKYNSNGQTQWARSPTVAPSDSAFQGTDIDHQGNVYVAGSIDGTGQYNFGNNVTAKGSYSVGNLLLVNYNSNGDPVLAKSVTSGNSYSMFLDLHTSRTPLGDIYASGGVVGNGIFDLGNNITVNGSFGGVNAVIAKYRGNYIIPESSSSSSSSNNSPVTSKASSITHRLPKLFAVGGVILLLF